MTIANRSFTWAPMPETTVQAGASTLLADKVQATGTSRAFLVADPGVVAAGLVAPMEASLTAAGIEHTTFSDVDPNPTDVNVDAGLTGLRAFGKCVVVLVGGGSAMDCGKYLAIAGPNEGSGVDFAFCPGLDGDDKIDFGTLMPPRLPGVDPYPTVAVPTTSGTASETNGGGLITDTATDRKLTFSHDGAKPKAVLLDPLLTLGLPPVPTATCGMDVLTHAIEALTSTNNNPLSDGLALQAIRMVGTWLPRLMDDPADVEGRAQMMVASHLAGRAFSLGPLLGLVHATGHPVSAVLHQPHGQTLATMLPHVMRFNLETVTDRYAQVAQALEVGDPRASDEANADAAIDAVMALSGRVGTAKTLVDLGATSDHFPALVEQALSDLIILTTPRYPSRADVHDLYERAMGRPATQ